MKTKENLLTKVRNNTLNLTLRQYLTELNHTRNVNLWCSVRTIHGNPLPVISTGTKTVEGEWWNLCAALWPTHKVAYFFCKSDKLARKAIASPICIDHIWLIQNMFRPFETSVTGRIQFSRYYSKTPYEQTPYALRVYGEAKDLPVDSDPVSKVRIWATHIGSRSLGDFRLPRYGEVI